MSLPSLKISAGGNHLGLGMGRTGVRPRHPFLLANLQHFPVAIGVNIAAEGWATGRSVLRKKPTRFVADPARVAEGFCAQWARPPLRRLLHLTVTAPPLNLGPNRLGLGPLLLLLRGRLRRGRRARRRRGREGEQRAQRPHASVGFSIPYRSRLGRYLHFTRKTRRFLR